MFARRQPRESIANNRRQKSGLTLGTNCMRFSNEHKTVIERSCASALRSSPSSGDISLIPSPGPEQRRSAGLSRERCRYAFQRPTLRIDTEEKLANGGGDHQDLQR